MHLTVQAGLHTMGVLQGHGPGQSAAVHAQAQGVLLLAFVQAMHGSCTQCRGCINVWVALWAEQSLNSLCADEEGPSQLRMNPVALLYPARDASTR